MNIFEELGFTGREAELLRDIAELRITVEQQAAEIIEQRALIRGTAKTVAQQAVKIERLEAENTELSKRVAANPYATWECPKCSNYSVQGMICGYCRLDPSAQEQDE